MTMTYDPKTDTVTIKNYVPEIKERIAYQVGSRLFRTKTAAAKAQAWSWILGKYQVLADVKKVLDMECDCPEHDAHSPHVQYQYPHEACSLHDRYQGYFKKLHKRLVKHILRVWEPK